MTAKRRIYLNMMSADKARDLLLSRFAPRPLNKAEHIRATDAVGRVLAEPAFATLSSPGYHGAAMDGVAVRAADTFGTSEARPLVLTIGEDAFYVNTGHRLPPNTDAVIMIENVAEKGENTIEIHQAAAPWQYVRKVGEDIVATQMLFPQNHRITPTCVAALLSGGAFTVAVRRRPRVLVVPTGNELVDFRRVETKGLLPGQVVETNSWMIKGLVEQAGGQAFDHQIAPDDFFVIRQSVDLATKGDYDLVLVLAGSSAGSEDHTANIIENLGQVLIHGVTLMPGKPLVAGDVRGVPVMGVPGYPVSAIVAFEEFIGPLLGRMLGTDPSEARRPRVNVEPTRKIPSKLGIEDIVRVKLGRVGAQVVATPLPRGAGSITSFTEADGIVRIGANKEGLAADERVSAELIRPLSSIDRTIVAVGSHDNTLDLLADAVRAADPSMTFSSVHVGSLGGLLAMGRGKCHVAGSHLLDTTDGSYNVSYIKKYLRGTPVRLLHLAMRDQGLIVARGNPKNIRTIADLARDDVVFINRQAGSGTRVLFDYELARAGITPDNITGYAHEETTHMAVAVAVTSGAADAGLGILSAARALDLDFIPVMTEQYDLVIAEEYFATPMVQVLVNIVQTPEFAERVTALGGYHTQRTGAVERVNQR